MISRCAIAIFVVTLAACTHEPPSDPPKPSPVAVQDVERAPVVTAADAAQAGAFRPLDGAWVGVFTVYADSRGQQAGPRPTVLDPAVFTKPPYRKELELRVRQEYVSESPTFQRVTIRDTYADGRVVVSKGVNKVQDGVLYCVVRKPDDLVVHTGTRPDPKTIVWTRDRPDPLAVEWFKETVDTSSYTIVGWGYYPGDDTSKRPRLFFSARYERVN